MDDDGLGEFVLGGKPSPRAASVARVFFGLLGTALGLFGAWHLWTGGKVAGLPLRLAMVAFLLAIATFFLANVALGRRWRWTLWWVALGLPLVFLVRLVFGA
jgi:hypothetical protein